MAVRVPPLSPRGDGRQLLILGLGNPICGDDGVGVAAVATLSRRYDALEDNVRFVDGGTLGLMLMPYFEEATHVLLVDAIRDGERPPGSFVRLRGDEVAPAVRERLSVHQIGVSDLLDGLRLIGRYPDHLELLGLVPATLDLGLGLSEPVKEALPSLVERTALTAAALGFPLMPRRADEVVADVPGALDLGWAVGV